MTRVRAVCLLLSVLCLVPAVRAQDVSGSKDHKLISRYEGSVIVKHERKAFEKYTLALGNQVWDGSRSSGKLKLSEAQEVSGRLTRITYLAPEGRSALEIWRNYEDAMEAGGFEILYRCIERECGERFASAAYPLRVQELPGSVGTIGIQDQHYLAARLSRPQGDVYVALFVYFDKSTFVPKGANREVAKAMLAQLDIIEVGDMEGGKVQLDAALMKREIVRLGHVALYEIYFEHDKSELKPESDPTLLEILKLLDEDPALRLLVVGHTDNVGTFDYNLDLSRRRAIAVVNALVVRHKVDARRLGGHGVGFLAPVATNESEEGRAKNRRVELVKW